MPICSAAAEAQSLHTIDRRLCDALSTDGDHRSRCACSRRSPRRRRPGHRHRAHRGPRRRGAGDRVVYAEPIDAPAPRAPRTVHARAEEQDVPAARAGGAGRIDASTFRTTTASSTTCSRCRRRSRSTSVCTAPARRVSATFTAPGIYRVFCNIHPQMTAIIVVAPSALHDASPAPDGRFTLDLPPGRYRMTALSERAHRRSRSRPRAPRARRPRGPDARRDRRGPSRSTRTSSVRTIRPPRTRSRAALEGRLRARRSAAL